MQTFNKTAFGGLFSPDMVVSVWIKATPIPGFDPAVIRTDVCGAPIRLSDYGNCSSNYGWEIDHIVAKARGGSDDLSNLQPLQWENNRGKADKAPGAWSCAVTWR